MSNIEWYFRLAQQELRRTKKRIANARKQFEDENPLLVDILGAAALISALLIMLWFTP